MAAYANAHFGMFSGESVNVRLEFENELAGSVIDRFGTEVMLVPDGEGRFTVTVPVAVTAPFFGWLCSFGDRVRILSPESAAEAMKNHVESIAKRYREEEK
jgi:predicted DNA-binding transcriptional regulator YafY